jgi:hypothetical protein
VSPDKDATGVPFETAGVDVKPASWRRSELDIEKFFSSALEDVIEEPN